jgi:3-deoxy-D-manno-octulosonic-acid transferase
MLSIKQSSVNDNRLAAYSTGDLYLDGSKIEGQMLLAKVLKLMLRAFNGECDSFIARVNYKNIWLMEQRINSAFEQINKLATSWKCQISQKYLANRVAELQLAYEYEERKQEEKEEQARIREQIREEEKAAREAMKAQEEASKEEAKYEVLLQQAFKSKPLAEWKLILVPHDLHENQLKQLQSALGSACVRYSQNPSREQLHQAKYLIIDTIGLLSKIYRYGQIAYIGGGFGQGIHNTLEAAVYGLPVIFGPKHDKFLEARELLELDAAFEVIDAQSLQITLTKLTSDITLREKIALRLDDYFEQKCGATARVMEHLRSNQIL